VSLNTITKVSRTTPAARAALEVMVIPATPMSISQSPAPTEPVKLKLVAQFNLPKINEKDYGVDIGQEVVTIVPLGKPVTMIDVSSGPGRRFIVQVTVARVPVE
jgi:hypothetical protein